MIRASKLTISEGLFRHLDPLDQAFCEPGLTQLLKPPGQGAPFLITTPGRIENVGFARVSSGTFDQGAALEQSGDALAGYRSDDEYPDAQRTERARRDAGDRDY